MSGESGKFAADFYNTNGAAGNSFGVLIDAGGNSADQALRIRNRAGAVEFMTILGDGSVSFGTTQGNLSGAHTPGVNTIVAVEGASSYGVLELATAAADNNGTPVAVINFVYPTNTGGAAEKRIALIEVDSAGTTANQRGGTISFYTKKDASGTFNTTTMDRLGDWTFSGNLFIPGAVSKYLNVTTAGWGVPAIYAFNRGTGFTGAVNPVATYTCGASDGSFKVSGNVNITAGATYAFQLTVHYTDADTNTARTQNIPVLSVGGGFTSAIQTPTSGVGTYVGTTVHLRVKASTAITVETEIIAGGNFTDVTYNVEGLIEQVG